MKFRSFRRCLSLALAIGMTGSPVSLAFAQEPSASDLNANEADVQEQVSGQTEPDSSAAEEAVQEDPLENSEQQPETVNHPPNSENPLPAESEPEPQPETEIQTAAGQGFSVQAEIPAGALPEGTVLQAVSLSSDSPETAAALACLGLDPENTAAAALNIEWIKDGIAIQPSAPVKITLQIDQSILSAMPYGLMQMNWADGTGAQPAASQEAGSIIQNGSSYLASFEAGRAGILLASVPKEKEPVQVLEPYSAKLQVKTILRGLSAAPAEFSLIASGTPARQTAQWSQDSQGALQSSWQIEPAASQLELIENGSALDSYRIKASLHKADESQSEFDPKEGSQIQLSDLKIPSQTPAAISTDAAQVPEGTALLLALEDGSQVILTRTPVSLSAQNTLKENAKTAFGSDAPAAFYVLPADGTSRSLSAGAGEFNWDPQIETIDLTDAKGIVSAASVGYDSKAAGREDLTIVSEYFLLPEPEAELPADLPQEQEEALQPDELTEMPLPMEASETQPQTDEAAEPAQSKTEETEEESLPENREVVPTGLRQDRSALSVLIAGVIGAVLLSGKGRRRTQ